MTYMINATAMAASAEKSKTRTTITTEAAACRALTTEPRQP